MDAPTSFLSIYRHANAKIKISTFFVGSFTLLHKQIKKLRLPLFCRVIYTPVYADAKIEICWFQQSGQTLFALMDPTRGTDAVIGVVERCALDHNYIFSEKILKIDKLTEHFNNKRQRLTNR